MAVQLGYNISIYSTPDFVNLDGRMTMSTEALCTPTNVNVAVPAMLAFSQYNWFTVGSVGHSQKQGVYTTTDLVEYGLTASPAFSADFWRDYVTNDELISAVGESGLRNSSTSFFPPHGMFCPDHVFGCMNQCSKTYACTRREEDDDKECLVVVAFSFRSTYGFWPSLLANLGIPAYFCYIGRDGVEGYVLERLASQKGVLFYMNDPDEFLAKNRGDFQRISFPKADPEELIKNTWQFGENGYGEPNINPIRVEYSEDVLQKVSSISVQHDTANEPAMTLLSRFRVIDLHESQLLQRYVATTSDSDPSPDPYFDAACSWARDNYDTWSRWMDPMPLCSLVDHMHYDIAGCNASYREISFEWKLPDPANVSAPYECDGGRTTLPSLLMTSRSCQWLEDRSMEWLDWTVKQPPCDFTFYTYEAATCNADGKREITFRWLLPDAANASASMECSGGEELPAPAFVDCEYMPIESSAFIAISALIVAQACVILVAMVVVFLKRDIPIVRRSQFEFLETMLVGAFCTCAAALAYAGEPYDALCAVRPALLSVGFTLIFGSLVVKSLRVYRVFMSKKLKRVVLPTSTMFKILGSFLLVDMLVLVVWFAADFPRAEDIEYRADAVFIGAKLAAKQCASSSFIYSALLIFWKTILLCAGLYLSFLVRNVSLDFQESIWIFGSAVVVGFGCVLLLPLAYMVTVAATTFYIFLAITLWLCTLMIVAMMLGPKLVRHKEAASTFSSASETKPGGHGSSTTTQNNMETHTTKHVTTDVSRSRAGSRSSVGRAYIVKPTHDGPIVE